MVQDQQRQIGIHQIEVVTAKSVAVSGCQSKSMEFGKFLMMITKSLH